MLNGILSFFKWLGFLQIILFSHLSWAMSCEDIFFDTSTAGTHYITDTSGLDGINYSDPIAIVSGWGRIKQKPIFTPSEIEQLRYILYPETDQPVTSEGAIEIHENLGTHSQELIAANPEIPNFEVTLSTLVHNIELKISKSTADKLEAYIREVENEIRMRTGRHFTTEFWIRREDSKKFSSGHYHGQRSITVTHAELGEGSWLEPYGKNKGRFTFDKNDEASVFTSELHGGTYSKSPRLLLIFTFHFRDKASEYSNI